MADWCYGKENSPLPYELSLGLDWQNFHTAPAAGGLLDQPLQLFHKIKLCLNVYNVITAYEAAASMNSDALVRWINNNKKAFQFLEYIWSLDDNAADE